MRVSGSNKLRCQGQGAYNGGGWSASEGHTAGRSLSTPRRPAASGTCPAAVLFLSAPGEQLGQRDPWDP